MVLPASEKEKESFLDFQVKILTSLASRDALKIFLASESGIESSTKALKDLGLTQKRYYTWLKRLIDAGLIEKNDGLYSQTFFGRVIHESFFKLLKKSLVEKKGYEFLDKLQKSNLDLDVKKKIADTLSRAGIVGLLGGESVISSVKIFDSFERLVKEIIELVDGTKESLYLASKYNDSKVVEAILRAVNRGVKASFIGEKKKLSENLQAIRMMLNPRIMRDFIKLIGVAKDLIRNIDQIPFSFVVLDEKWVVIELPNPLTNDFYIGFTFQDPTFAKKVISSFKDLWTMGDEPLESERAK